MTMIEKMARAMDEVAFTKLANGIPGYEYRKLVALDLARAALTAMLEPSNDQLVVGARIHPSAYMGYQAMIQAALDEKDN